MGTRGPKPRTGRNSRRVGKKSPWWGFRPPDDFDDEALIEFDRLRNALKERGLLDVTDPRMVTMAVSLHRVIVEASEQVVRSTKEGTLVYETPNGCQAPHPMLAVLTNTTTRLRGLLNDMRLTPKSLTAAALAKEDAEAPVSNKWGGILDATG